MKHLFPILLCLLFVSCDSPTGQSLSAWTNVLRDPPEKPAMHFSLLCDRSIGSTCSESTLSANIEAAIRTVADRPGSTVAIFALGPDLASTRELGRVTVARPTIRRERARAAHTKRLIEEARAALLRDAQPLFAADPLRSSPLAEGIMKVALSRPLPQHTIIVTSDALEFSKSTGFDMECRVPKPERFTRRLQELSLFTPGSLRGTRVAFVNQQLGSIGGNRCDQSLARVTAVRAAWTAAGRAAGATATFSTDSFGGDQ